MIYKYISKLVNEGYKTIDYVFDFNGRKVYYFGKNHYGATDRDHFYQILKVYKKSPDTIEEFSYDKIKYSEIEIEDKDYYIKRFISYIFENDRTSK